MAIGRKVGNAYVEVGTRTDSDDAAAEIEGGISAAFGKAGGGAKVGVAAGAAGAILGAAAVKGVLDAIDREQIEGQLAARLGASGDEAEELGRIAGSLYSNAFGESLEDVATALGDVEINLGDFVDTSGLEDATEDALNLAKVLDEDVASVARTAGQLVRNGLAANAEEAFDIIAAGSTEGLNRADDLLDTLNEYAPVFSRLGLDGEAALALIDQGLDAGAFNADKIGDAFNEFSIRAIDGSDATSDALTALGLNAEETAALIAAGGPAAADATADVLEALRGIDDQVAQDAAGVALFGSIWEDLGADILLSLDPAEDALGDVSSASEDLGDTLNNNLGTRLETLKRRGFQALADAAERFLIPALEFTLDAAEDIAAWVERHWPEIERTISDAVRRVEQVVVPIVDGLVAAWALFGENVIRHVHATFETIQATFEAVVSILDGVIDFITAVFTGDWEAAWEAIEQIFTGIIDAIVATVKGFVDIVFNTLDAFLKAVAVLWDWSFLSDIIGGAVDGVLGFLGDLDDKARTLFSGLVTFITDKVGEIVDEVVALPGRLIELAGDLLAAGVDLGESLIDGLVDGITGAAGFVGDVVNNITDALINGFKTVWDNVIADPINSSVRAAVNALDSALGPFVNFGDPGDLVPTFFADGGVVTEPTLAMIGETARARPEIVTPERLMAETFRGVLAETGNGGGGGVTFQPGAIRVELASGSPSEAAAAGRIVADQVARRLNERRTRTMERLSMAVDA